MSKGCSTQDGASSNMATNMATEKQKSKTPHQNTLMQMHPAMMDNWREILFTEKILL